jgi:hypothetical protein
MQSFQTEIDAMRAAQRDLARYREILDRQRAKADELRTSVPKSTSSIHDPVADKLHDVFANRADPHGGVQGVLNDYLRELDKIQLTITATLDAYDAAERGAIARYGKEAR